EALQLYIEAMMQDGKPVPAPRHISEIKADPEWADDVAQYMVALIPAPLVTFRPAAE
ncbi:MAG: HicB family protein, partial [Methylobacterium sp.]|nr:HicB family protein [Methylobacterium sp.]